MTYTNRGQRETDTVTGTYAYDDAGQLETRTLPDESSVSYGYDEDGRRTSETHGTEIRSYTWNEVGQLAAIGDPDRVTELTYSDEGWLKSSTVTPTGEDSLERGYTWDTTNSHIDLAQANGSEGVLTAVTGPGRLTSIVAGNGELDPVSRNLIDTPDVAGVIDPWGQDISLSASDSSAGYRGEVTVDGLAYLRNRLLDPVTAQFLSTDPLPAVSGSTEASNTYHYAENDPVTKIDPLGLRQEDCGFLARPCLTVVNDLQPPVGDPQSVAEPPDEPGPSLSILPNLSFYDIFDYVDAAVWAAQLTRVDTRLLYAVAQKEMEGVNSSFFDHIGTVCHIPYFGCVNTNPSPTNVQEGWYGWAAVNSTWSSYISNHSYGSMADHPNQAMLVTAIRLAELTRTLRRYESQLGTRVVRRSTCGRPAGAEGIVYCESSLLSLAYIKVWSKADVLLRSALRGEELHAGNPEFIPDTYTGRNVISPLMEQARSVLCFHRQC